MSNAKLLIVEDEELVLEIMSQKAEERKYQVVTATNGEEAWQKIQSDHPAVIIMDLEIPEIDGISLLEKLKQEYPHSIPPRVIVVSGHDAETFKHKTNSLEVDCYLQKPCDLDVIFEAVESSSYQKQKDFHISNREATKVLIIDDDHGDQFLIKEVLQREGFRNLSLASNGEEGIEKIRRERPDIAIVDTILPDISGLELCQSVKNLSDTKTIVIVITGDVDAVDIKGVNAAGGFDSVVKTPDYGLLVEAMKKIQLG